MRRLRVRLLRITPDEVAFSRRGFHQGDAEVVRLLERAGEEFVSGYRRALEDWEPEHPDAACRVARDDERAGFAHEGAAMALALLDGLTPWRRGGGRLSRLASAAPAHVYLVHIGAGWALARLPAVAWRRVLDQLDPVLRWLALDGLAFHQCYFSREVRHRGLASRAARAAFPQPYASAILGTGVGRALWFVHGASVPRLVAALASAPADRLPALLSGAALAAAYVGGAGAGDLRLLRDAAGQHLPHAAQGAAFAAKARALARNPAPHTDLACSILCGLGAADAAALVERAWLEVADGPATTAFPAWRERVQRRLGGGDALATERPGAIQRLEPA